MHARSRSRAWYKANGAARFALARNWGIVPSQYLVNEYPKSGGTWLAQMLEAFSGVPYPRLRFPLIGPNVLHSHYRTSSGVGKCVIVWRDPRDILVSHFFHVLHLREETSRANTMRVRGLMGLNESSEIDFDTQFPDFYQLVMSRSIHPRFTWCDFFDSWFAHSGVVHTSYESLHANTASELTRIASSLGLNPKPDTRAEDVVESMSFANQSGRKAGESNDKAFLRKGVVGDWRNTISNAMLSRITDDFGSRISQYENSDLYQPRRGSPSIDVELVAATDPN